MNKRLLFLLIFLGQLPFLFSQNKILQLEDSIWQFKDQDSNVYLPAKVPGNIHTDLLRNGLIPDPFLGTNESLVQWVGQRNWVYKTQFILSSNELKETHHELVLENIDTYADVFVNGQKVATTQNQFRKYVVQVHGLLKVQNEIQIIFHSVLPIARKEAEKYPYTYPGDDKVFVRKAQYQFGWDWGPTLLTCGIGNVSLHCWSVAKLRQNQYQLISYNPNQAILRFNLSIESDSTIEAKLNHIFSNEGQTHISQITLPLKAGLHVYPVEININKPILWWCNGFGKAHLYPFSFMLFVGKEFIGSNQMEVGIRTVEWIQKPDSVGSNFLLQLNGVPIYSKGANYIPPHSFVNGLNDSVYRYLVQNASEANMNMLRVWGGGVYAPEAFYEACDKSGIMVWQDFMFACAMYPAHKDIAENIEEEAKDQVQRLRNHASLVMWCGNNEVDEGWKNWGWQKQYAYSYTDSSRIAQDYQKIFNELLPIAVAQHDSGRFYWPSSPSIGWGRKESLLQGDAHYWGVWWGMLPFEMYEQKVGRFMSEYGFQGMPSAFSFQKFMRKGLNPIDSAELLQHQKHPIGYQTIQTYLQRDYAQPNNFEDYIYTSQLLQARGMKTAIEAHRRAKPYNMGTLFWQLNDCWPVTSWSSTDYFGNKKAAYYQIKRSFEPVIISFEADSIHQNLTVKLINDGWDSLWGYRSYRFISLRGKKTITYTETPARPMYLSNGKANTLYFFEQILENKFLKNPADWALEVSFQTHTKTYKGLYFFVPPKSLNLPKVKLHIQLYGDSLICLSSNTLAKDVYIFSKQGELNVSDNFFDLLPGEKKWIIVQQKGTGLKQEDLLVKTYTHKK
jgi:beta-mannosidase